MQYGKSSNFIFKYLKKDKKCLILSFIILIIIAILELVPPYTMQFIFDDGIMKKNFSLIINLSILSFIIYISLSVLNYAVSYMITHLSEKLVFNIKSDIISKIIDLPLSFFTKSERGYLLGRVDEVNKIKSIISVSNLKIFVYALQFIIISIILININLKLFVLVLITLPFYFLICKYLLGHIRLLSQVLMEKNAISMGKFQQFISGIQTIKIMNYGKEEEKKLKEINEELLSLSIKQNLVFTIISEGLMLLNYIISLLIVLFASKAIINQSMTLGTYITFSSLLPKILMPIQLLATNSISIQPGLIAIQRTYDLFMRYPDNEINTLGEKINKINGDIAVNKISFKYEEQDNNIFENLSFDIKSGQKVGIFGSNGSGKTTLIKLIAGLYSGYNGDILIDGKNIENINKISLLQRIGLISQDIFLFNGTIKDNIYYGYDDELINYSSIPEFESIISQFSQGLLTQVGENGQLLSGGQKQLIGVLRVLLKKPDLLILDEATNHLDDEIKNLILFICDKYFKNKTCIYITHNKDEIHFDKEIQL